MAEPAGLYVHIPFCRTRCRYCDFYSETVPPSDAYVEAVLREAELAGEGFGGFDTLYVGGGTPSVLAPAQLAALLAGLRQRVAVAPGAEVTVEMNPDDVDDDWLETLSRCGVTRISLGVQSFVDETLTWLGRRHDAARAVDAARRVRSAGFAALGLDLIFGWPGQTAGQWQDDLERALDLAPDHLSCYQLTVEPGTPLHGMVRRGEAMLSDEEAQRARFLQGARFLSDRGWDHYEVSNYARTSTHRSRHNAKYWRHVDYLGLGPAAHSLLGRRRWWNERSLSTYLEGVGRDLLPRSGEEVLDDEAWQLETLMLGFRTADGVPRDVLRDVPNAERVILDLLQEGRIRLLDGVLKPTLDGLLMADGLPLRFFGVASSNADDDGSSRSDGSPDRGGA